MQKLEKKVIDRLRGDPKAQTHADPFALSFSTDTQSQFAGEAEGAGIADGEDGGAGEGYESVGGILWVGKQCEIGGASGRG